VGFSRKYYTEAERRDEDARMYPPRGIALPAPAACPEATASTVREPPAFLLKRNRFPDTPAPRALWLSVARYDALLDRMFNHMATGDYLYWRHHINRLYRLAQP
jgi:hypothetical protein